MGAVAGQGGLTLCAPPSDLNKACGNAMDAHEAAQMHQNFSQQLLQDHIEACSLPEHNLITVRARGRGGWRQNGGAVGSSGPAHLGWSPQGVGQTPCGGSTHLATISLPPSIPNVAWLWEPHGYGRWHQSPKRVIRGASQGPADWCGAQRALAG